MQAFDFPAALPLAAFELFWPVALAATAALGYRVGRGARASGEETATRCRGDLRRAQRVARKLEKIAWVIRRNLARRPLDHSLGSWQRGQRH